MTTSGQLPNFSQIAARVDMLVPHYSPVTEALLEHLLPAPEERILDIACGTGEPGLTLARRRITGVTVMGVDAAQGMVEAARRKASALELANIKFLMMKAESLEFADSSFDGVLSRFGLMLLEQPRVGCFEMLRVLKAGGRYAVAVWDEGERNTLFCAIAQAFNRRVPPELQFPIERASQLAGPEVLSQLLKECGASHAETELFHFEMKFSDFEEIWTLVQDSGTCDRQLGSLSIHERLAAKEQLENLLCAFKRDGGYRIPHYCRLAWGKR
jgi:ubiquinone/menaquinone biosynthesis C-methylase UbiE